MDVRIDARMRALKDKFMASGLEPAVLRNPDDIEAMMADVGKDDVHPISRISIDEVQAGRAFWLALKRGGRYVTCISARLEHSGDVNFRDHWEAVCALSYPGEEGLVLAVSPDLERLRGDLVYFGGVQVAAGEKGNISRLSRFCDYARCVTCANWKFDWIYTIINSEHQKLARVYGFKHSAANAVTWAAPVPAGLANDQVFLLSNYREAVDRLVSNPGQKRDHRSDVAI